MKATGEKKISIVLGGVSHSLLLVRWPPGHEDKWNRSGKQGWVQPVSTEETAFSETASVFQLSFIPEWGEVSGRVGPAAGAAQSYHTAGSPKPNYHMGCREGASAGICVKDHR